MHGTSCLHHGFIGEGGRLWGAWRVFRDSEPPCAEIGPSWQVSLVSEPPCTDLIRKVGKPAAEIPKCVYEATESRITCHERANSLHGGSRSRKTCQAAVRIRLSCHCMRSETPAITRAINLAKVEPQELRAVRFIELPNRALTRLGYFFRAAHVGLCRFVDSALVRQPVR